MEVLICKRDCLVAPITNFLIHARVLRAPSPDKKIDVSFDQIYDALITYRKEVQPEGSLIVPSKK